MFFYIVMMWQPFECLADEYLIEHQSFLKSKDHFCPLIYILKDTYICVNQRISLEKVGKKAQVSPEQHKQLEYAQ